MFKTLNRIPVSRYALGMATCVGTASAMIIARETVYSESESRLKSEIQNLLSAAKISTDELRNHKSKDSIWITINSQVYDLTEFVFKHPGGAKIIMQYAGKDASSLFNMLHPLHVLETYAGEIKHVGELTESAPIEEKLEHEVEDNSVIPSPNETKSVKKADGSFKLPSLSKIFNINDFESIARKILPPDAWAYYSGGADDEITLRENHYAFHKYFFYPKVLVDVRNVDISTTMLGSKTDAPFYCSAAALAHLGHKDGELSISKGCAGENVIQMISSTSSYPLDDILDVATPEQNHWFQLYVTSNRDKAYATLQKCKDRGVKGIFVTVDTPVLGRREKDFKFRFVDSDEDDRILSYDDPGLTWDDIDKFKKFIDLPIAVKGLQRTSDVLLAIEHGVDAIVLSNHGGRQLDFAKAPVDILAEVMPILRSKKLDDKVEIYIDGGIRRGSDIVKALCLGAKGVGLGRAFLYANSGYGEPGVKKAIQLLKDEVTLTMKLLGVTKVSELNPSFIDLKSVNSRKFHDDSLYDSNYERMQHVSFGTR